MKRKLKMFLGFCVVLLAAYAAVDVLSENYLSKTTHKPAVRLKESTYAKVDVPIVKKDGTKCRAILIVRNVLGTGVYEIKDKQLACEDRTNYFIRNIRIPDFKDEMVVGKKPEIENKDIRVMPYPSWRIPVP